MGWSELYIIIKWVFCVLMSWVEVSGSMNWLSLFFLNFIYELMVDVFVKLSWIKRIWDC